MPFANLAELNLALEAAVEFVGDGVEIKDAQLLRGELVDRLARSAVFGDGPIRQVARHAIWSASQALGCGAASIQGLYDAMGRGDIGGFTVPAINIRGLTYDVARTVFRAAQAGETGPVLFEIARSEIDYTEQRPAEYAACVLAAALREGWNLPVLLQGDHFQMDLERFKDDPDVEIEAVRDLIREAVAAGFFNVDIDASTLVDLEQPTLEEQQRRNYEQCAAITTVIRQLEPQGITISIGGEIGEVGGKNSTVEEFHAFMSGFVSVAPDIKGISKISVQTGTTHGGMPLADGTIAEVGLDFSVLEDIGRIAREDYGISGAVQHGASTLPDDAFHRFPECGTAEIHLATGFQNIIYDHQALSADLRETIYAHLRNSLAAERKPDQTDEQFIYKTRKKGFGPFKRQWWDLSPDVREGMMHTLYDKLVFLFDRLGTRNTAEIVKAHLLPVPVAHARPQ